MVDENTLSDRSSPLVEKGAALPHVRADTPISSNSNVSLAETGPASLRRNIRSTFSRNSFVFLQLMGTTALATSGFLAGNEGRAYTGLYNTLKNSTWLGLNLVLPKFGKTPLKKEMNEAASNSVGAGLSALTNAPQFFMNAAPAFKGAAESVAYGDIIGAAAGIVAYSMMSINHLLRGKDYYQASRVEDEANPGEAEGFVEASEAGTLVSELNKEGPQMPGVVRKRTAVKGNLGPKGNLDPLSQPEKARFIFEKLPYLLLLCRGLSFTIAGGASMAADTTLPSVLMLAAGGFFTVSSGRSLFKDVFNDQSFQRRLKSTLRKVNGMGFEGKHRAESPEKVEESSLRHEDHHDRGFLLKGEKGGGIKNSCCGDPQNNLGNPTNSAKKEPVDVLIRNNDAAAQPSDDISPA